MICLDSSSMIAYLEGQEGKDITLIDHPLFDQIAVFAPVTVTELLSASTISPSLRETLLAIPMLSIDYRGRILGTGRTSTSQDPCQRL